MDRVIIMTGKKKTSFLLRRRSGGSPSFRLVFSFISSEHDESKDKTAPGTQLDGFRLVLADLA
jgi:hypothetical protein